MADRTPYENVMGQAHAMNRNINRVPDMSNPADMLMLLMSAIRANPGVQPRVMPTARDLTTEPAQWRTPQTQITGNPDVGIPANYMDNRAPVSPRRRLSVIEGGQTEQVQGAWVRVRGNVYHGRDPVEAYMNAGNELGMSKPEMMDLIMTRKPADEGYVTNQGRQISREEAARLPGGPGERNPNYPEGTKTPTQEPQARDARGETVSGAAMRVGDKIYTGRTHMDAAHNAGRELGISPDRVYEMVLNSGRRGDDGFVTNTGRFVTRQEAAALEGGRGRLVSEDLKGRRNTQGVEGSGRVHPLTNNPDVAKRVRQLHNDGANQSEIARTINREFPHEDARRFTHSNVRTLLNRDRNYRPAQRRQTEQQQQTGPQAPLSTVPENPPSVGQSFPSRETLNETNWIVPKKPPGSEPNQLLSTNAFAPAAAAATSAVTPAADTAPKGFVQRFMESIQPREQPSLSQRYERNNARASGNYEDRRSWTPEQVIQNMEEIIRNPKVTIENRTETERALARYRQDHGMPPQTMEDIINRRAPVVQEPFVPPVTPGQPLPGPLPVMSESPMARAASEVNVRRVPTETIRPPKRTDRIAPSAGNWETNTYPENPGRFATRGNIQPQPNRSTRWSPNALDPNQERSLPVNNSRANIPVPPAASAPSMSPIYPNRGYSQPETPEMMARMDRLTRQHIEQYGNAGFPETIAPPPPQWSPNPLDGILRPMFGQPTMFPTQED